MYEAEKEEPSEPNVVVVLPTNLEFHEKEKRPIDSVVVSCWENNGEDTERCATDVCHPTLQ